MYVDSLNKMEEIVSSREDLMWENFNVVQLKTKTPTLPLESQHVSSGMPGRRLRSTL